jgi:putative lipoprotein
MRLAILLPAATLLAGCATTPGGQPRALGGTDWRLVELGGRPVTDSASTGGGIGSAPYLRFASDSGRAGGATGCNRFGGPFTLAGDSLRFGALVATRAACVDPARQAREGDFLRALEATRRHAISGDTLALFGDEERPLARFVASPAGTP